MDKSIVGSFYHSMWPVFLHNAVQHQMYINVCFVGSCGSFSPVATASEDHCNPDEDIHRVQIDTDRAAVT